MSSNECLFCNNIKNPSFAVTTTYSCDCVNCGSYEITQEKFAFIQKRKIPFDTITVQLRNKKILGQITRITNIKEGMKNEITIDELEAGAFLGLIE